MRICIIIMGSAVLMLLTAVTWLKTKPKISEVTVPLTEIIEHG